MQAQTLVLVFEMDNCYQKPASGICIRSDQKERKNTKSSEEYEK